MGPPGSRRRRSGTCSRRAGCSRPRGAHRRRARWRRLAIDTPGNLLHIAMWKLRRQGLMEFEQLRPVEKERVRVLGRQIVLGVQAPRLGSAETGRARGRLLGAARAVPGADAGCAPLVRALDLDNRSPWGSVCGHCFAEASAAGLVDDQGTPVPEGRGHRCGGGRVAARAPRRAARRSGCLPGRRARPHERGDGRLPSDGRGRLLPEPRRLTPPAQHAPQNAMTDAGEIARFQDRCSDLMRELLDGLADGARPARALPRDRGRHRLAAAQDRVRARRRLAHAPHRVRRPAAVPLPLRPRVRVRALEMWMDAAQARALRSSSHATAHRERARAASRQRLRVHRFGGPAASADQRRGARAQCARALRPGRLRGRGRARPGAQPAAAGGQEARDHADRLHQRAAATAAQAADGPRHLPADRHRGLDRAARAP